MRGWYLLLPLMLLQQACSEDQLPKEQVPVPLRDTVPTSIPHVEHTDWIGVYEGPVVAGNGEEDRVALWLRSSGTYVRTQGPSDGRSVPTGRIGYWQVADASLVLVEASSHMPQRWERRDGRLVPALPMRRAQGMRLGPVLEPMPGDPDARTPRMRLLGRHMLVNESHALEPCGSGRTLPLSVGEHLGDLMALRERSGQPLEAPLLLEVDVEMGLAMAMEGDEQDEYLWMVGPPRAVPAAACP